MVAHHGACLRRSYAGTPTVVAAEQAAEAQDLRCEVPRSCRRKSSRQPSRSRSQAASTELSVVPSGSMNCMCSKGEMANSGRGSILTRRLKSAVVIGRGSPGQGHVQHRGRQPSVLKELASSRVTAYV